MKALKVTRLAGNPHKRTKRKMSPKQIRIFGTKRQKAALKRKVSASRKPVTVKRHRPRTSPNPLVVTLKPLSARNPQRRNTVAKRAVKANRRRVTASRRTHNKKRRTRNPRPVMVARRAPNRKRRTTRRNPATRIVVMAPRRQNRRGVRQNPNLFGSSLGSKNSMKLIGGGLLGVAGTKFIPTWVMGSSLGASLSGIGSSTFGRVIISGGAALLVWKGLAMVDPVIGEGALFGGLMQVASVALNAFLPNLTIGGVPISLGDLVEGRFAVPQNPIRGGMNRMLPAPTPANMPAPAGSKITASGLGRAYTAAY